MIDKSGIEEIIDESFIDDSNVTVFLFENKKTKKDPISLYTLNVGNDVVEQLKSLSRDYTATVLDIFGSEELDEIPTYNPDQEQVIFKIDAKEVEVASIIDSYLSGESTSKLYDKKIVKEDKLKAWIIRYEFEKDNEIKRLFYFQKFQVSRMLGANWLTFFQHDNEFRLLGDNTLNMKLDMDFLLYEDTFVVTKMSAFEKIFGYEEFYKNNAEQFVNELAVGKIDGLDYSIKFSDIESVNVKIAKSTRFAHKLYSAKSNGYYKRIDYSRLADLSARYNFELQLDDEKKGWTIDENSNLQVMAQILNDDYERSQLTEIEYLAMGKEMMNKT